MTQFILFFRQLKVKDNISSHHLAIKTFQNSPSEIAQISLCHFIALQSLHQLLTKVGTISNACLFVFSRFISNNFVHLCIVIWIFISKIYIHFKMHEPTEKQYKNLLQEIRFHLKAFRLYSFFFLLLHQRLFQISIWCSRWNSGVVGSKQLSRN